MLLSECLITYIPIIQFLIYQINKIIPTERKKMNFVYKYALNIASKYSSYRNNVSQEAELSHLSDKILQDIGVSRASIHSVIWK